MTDSILDDDRFIGQWLVTEYVYNPDGGFAGIIRQRRHIEVQPGERIRVYQECEPDGDLSGHPLAAMRGEWIFDLTREGRARRYHGPAVIGSALQWGEDAMTSTGLWPGIGCNITTFALKETPERQITGGQFCRAGMPVATVITVGVPEEAGQPAAWPTLGKGTSPQTIADRWRGTVATYDGYGLLQGTTAMARTYTAEGWQDRYGMDYRVDIHLTDEGDYEQVTGSAEGLARRCGGLLTRILQQTPELTIHVDEVLDSESGYLVGIARKYIDEVYQQVEVFRLQPYSGAE